MIPLQARCGPEGVQRYNSTLPLTAALEGGWVVSSKPRPHVTPGKETVPILQEAGWAPGPVWTGGKSRPHRDSILDRPARSQSLCRPSYRADIYTYKYCPLLTKNVLTLRGLPGEDIVIQSTDILRNPKAFQRGSCITEKPRFLIINNFRSAYYITPSVKVTYFLTRNW